MKKCNKCGEVLPLHMFCKNKATKDKLNNVCKTCSKKYDKAYYEENKEGINKKKKVYYRENKEEIKKKVKAYSDKNKEKRLDYQRERILKLPDSYVRQLLNNQGIDESLITPEIMELKRAVLKVKRIIKQKESKNI